MSSAPIVGEARHEEIATCLDAALAYARRGLRVIPVNAVLAGRCTCQAWRDRPGPGACIAPGKHPRIKKWQTLGSTDATVIEKWFVHDFPSSNVGIVTGVTSGIFVLDVDPRHGGDETLDALQAKHGPLPDTLQATTGGGGRHFYFKHPGGVVPDAVGIMPGLDIRGDGGFVVAPPSGHVSGGAYS